MKWNKYTLKTTTEAIDYISGLMIELGIDGIQIEDNVPLSEEDKKAMFIDYLPTLPKDDGTAYISFYTEEDNDDEALLHKVREKLKEASLFINVGEGTIEKDITEDIDWVNNWKQFFKAFTVGEFYIKPTWEEMKDHAGKLVRKIREKYKKQGWILKYIYRLAIGSRGGRHIHILINREANEKMATDLIITDLWEQQWGHGHVNFRTLYSEGGYRQLAVYITKPLEKWESELKRYHPSRNLIRKDPETEEIKRRSLVDRDGKSRPPKAPKGYYVDPESIETGKNPVTGYAYRHYTLVKIKKKE